MLPTDSTSQEVHLTCDAIQSQILESSQRRFPVTLSLSFFRPLFGLSSAFPQSSWMDNVTLMRCPETVHNLNILWHWTRASQFHCWMAEWCDTTWMDDKSICALFPPARWNGWLYSFLSFLTAHGLISIPGEASWRFKSAQREIIPLPITPWAGILPP